MMLCALHLNLIIIRYFGNFGTMLTIMVVTHYFPRRMTLFLETMLLRKRSNIDAVVPRKIFLYDS